MDPFLFDFTIFNTQSSSDILEQGTCLKRLIERIFTNILILLLLTIAIAEIDQDFFQQFTITLLIDIHAKGTLGTIGIINTT